ncbi:MAG: HD domain-containing protein [Bilifractor sp.]
MTEDHERFQKQLDFILEIDKEKNILRQTHLTGHGRREDDADHAWHLAVMAWILKEYANQEIDLVKTILMVLIHDLVEIDAGDTYAYDTEGKKTEKERETRAAARIFGLLPEDQGRGLRSLWEEFDAYQTPESRFAHVMDNFQPVLLNHSNGGSDWKEHGVRLEQVMGRNAKTGTGSEKIWSYMQEILQENVRKGSLKP